MILLTAVDTLLFNIRTWAKRVFANTHTLYLKPLHKLKFRWLVDFCRFPPALHQHAEDISVKSHLWL